MADENNPEATEVDPEEITEQFFTTTQPTEGFSFVEPR